MNEGVRVRCVPGAGGRRRRDGRHPSSSLSFLTHSTSLKYTIYNCTRSRAPSVAFTKCPSRERPYICAWRSCSPARASPRARTWSPSARPRLRGGIFTFSGAKLSAIQLQLFQRRARAGRARERVGPDHQRLDGGALLRFNALRFRHCSSALSSFAHFRKLRTRACPTARAPCRSYATTPHVRGAQRRARRRGRAHETREPRRAPELDGRQTGRGELHHLRGEGVVQGFRVRDANLWSVRGRARPSASAGQARQLRKKVPGLGSGSISDVETARVRERHDVLFDVHQNTLAQSAPCRPVRRVRQRVRRSIPHPALSTACVEEKRRTTLEDGSLGSERGERLGETSEGACALAPIQDRVGALPSPSRT